MKEKLLFIAPTVPLYDRNAGDLRLFTILKILATSYDITYLALNPSGGKSPEDDSYVSRLRDLGISVFIKNFSITDILRSKRFKAAILEFYPIAERYLPRIKMLQPSCPVIVDTVDLHYLRLQRKYQITKDGKDLLLSQETKTRELEIYAQADIILTATDEDARSLQDANNNLVVRTLPTVHSLVYPTNTGNRFEIIFVGGFIHDPNIDAVIYFCEDILPRVRHSIPEARFTIVGSNPPEKIKTLNNDFITVTGFVPSITPYLQKSFVSVAPIRYGAGIKGKIGEAMAHGLPVVTTSIGAEGMGLTDRENAMIADSPEKFSDAVIELMLDNNLYRTIQQNALDHIEKNYTPERVSKRMEHILAELDDLHVKKLSIATRTSFLVNYARNLAKKKFSYLFD